MTDTITLPRAEVERVLEALEIAEAAFGHPQRVKLMHDTANALRERLARQEQETVPAFRSSHAYSVGFADGQAAQKPARQEQEPCSKCNGLGYYDEGHENDDGTMSGGNYVECDQCKPT